MSGAIQSDLVSTIIPVFNRPDMIVESVNSVLHQDYRPIELILVDDGSTDNTPEVLLELQRQNPEIIVLRQSNAGPGAARELGRGHASGEFIQYHDSDDLLLPEKLSLQVDALRRHQECDVAYGKTEQIEFGESMQGIALKGTGKQYAAMFPQSLRSRWWATSTPLFRRAIIDKAGPWLATRNEEDWEYECRIAALGGRLTFVNAFVSIRRIHDDNLSEGGTVDPEKLLDRCIARTAIYQHALNYNKLTGRVTDIDHDDWVFFSKSVFLLARECAAAGLVEQAKAMIALSIKATNGTGLQQQLFSLWAKVFGWRCAAAMIKLLGR